MEQWLGRGLNKNFMETSARTKFILVLIGIFCFSVTIALAQGPGFPDPPVDTPFDGGVALIAVAATSYSIKKIRDRNKLK